MLVPVEILTFAVDPESHSPVVLLKEISGSRVVLVPIQHPDASSIAFKSMKVNPDLPLTIDLVRIVLEQLGGELSKIIICDDNDAGMIARLYISTLGHVHVIPCRPADAVSLAMRSQVALFAVDTLFDAVKGQKSSDNKDSLRRTLSGVNTLEFGSYFLE